MMEIIFAFLLILILILFLHPADLLMPQNAEMYLLVLLVVIFFVFTALFWREGAQDERDALHRMDAGRISFLVGSLFLLAGIVLQALNHNIDPWLIYTLVAMLLTKSLVRLYDRYKN